MAGFAREDLFCVVHDIFQTDTADYADIVLPATTQLEHLDVHSSYGHLYVLANNPAIAPVGEAKPNTEVFRLLAAAHGLRRAVLRARATRTSRGRPLSRTHPRAQGIDWETLKADGWQRLERALAVRAFRAGQLSDAVGQVRVLLRDAAPRRASIRCRPTRRRASRSRATPPSPSAIRWR